MRKLIITSITLCLGFTIANAQEIKEAVVPAKVKDSFAKKYPNSKAEEWIKEETNYEVEFKLNKVESSVLFTEDGVFKEVEQEIKIAELPKGVTDYCTKNYAGYKLSEAAKTTDDLGKITFEAEMEKGKEHFDVIFDDKGSFIKKEVSSTKDDGKD